MARHVIALAVVPGTPSRAGAATGSILQVTHTVEGEDGRLSLGHDLLRQQ